MKRTLTWLVLTHLSIPLPLAARAADDTARVHITYKLEATLVRVDLAAKTLTYEVAEGQGPRTAHLTEQSLSEAGGLKAGQRVTLRCRSSNDADEPVVESVKKKGSRKKLVIILLSVGLFVVLTISLANGLGTL